MRVRHGAPRGPRRSTRSLTSSVPLAGRRRQVDRAFTSTSGSIRVGASARFAGPRLRSPARSSDGRRRTSRRRGGGRTASSTRSSSTTTRTPATTRSRARTRSAGRRTAPCRRRSRWDEIDDVLPQDCTIATVPERFARLGDLHAGIDDAVFSLDPLLEWAERDEREGAADPGAPAQSTGG